MRYLIESISSEDWEQYLTQMREHEKYQDVDAPRLPNGSNKRFKSMQSAQEFAFLKHLEGCKTRLFHLNYDDDGDDMWEEL